MLCWIVWFLLCTQYVKSHYTSSRTVITAAGAVDHDELVKLVTEKFDLPQDPTTAEDLVRSQPSKFTGSEVCWGWCCFLQKNRTFFFTRLPWAYQRKPCLLETHHIASFILLVLLLLFWFDLGSFYELFSTHHFVPSNFHLLILPFLKWA